MCCSGPDSGEFAPSRTQALTARLGDHDGVAPGNVMGARKAAGASGTFRNGFKMRLLDNITGLSASGSRLVAENMGSGGEVATAMHDVIDNWRRHGFDVEMTDLWYAGDRHDVAQYLNGDGWETSETKMTELITRNGFTAPAPADDAASDSDSVIYVTASRR
jgi:hypothetical protein